MKRKISLLILFFAIVFLIGCAKNNDEIVLPPSRVGTDGIISASLDQQYTFETAFSSSDVVAHLKIGNWLSEDDAGCITYFEASVINCYKGITSQEIVLLQDGTSKRTLKNYPLFTSGNEILVYLKSAVDTPYGNAYWIIGSFSTFLDVSYDDSGSIFFMDRYGNLDSSMDSTVNRLTQTKIFSEVYKHIVSQDPIIADLGFNYSYIISENDFEKLLRNLG